MKKIIIIFLMITLSLPVYAKDKSEDESKKPVSFARQKFEFGFDVGVGFDNDLLKLGDFFQKEIVVDLNEIGSDVRDTGLTLNLGVGTEIFFNIKNVKIGENLWDFGFFAGVDGDIDLNIPKSMFTLITEGNIDKRVFEGVISASGSVYADAGLKLSAQFGKLRLGVAPSVFTPLIYVPKVIDGNKTGINYNLNTTEGVLFETSGSISVYSPFMTKNGEIGEIKFGGDLAAEAEFSLFSFLDIGGSVSNIPIFPAVMEDRVLLALGMQPLEVTPGDLLSGKGESFDFDFDFVENYNSPKEIKIHRPMRFDAHVKLKPFSNNFLVFKPSVGMSIDINNEETFFNAGLGIQLNLIDFFIIDASSSYTETIWVHQLGMALNLRAFELNLKAALRSSSLENSFQGQGFGVGVGLRFGW